MPKRSQTKPGFACPECGKWTEVIETRAYENHVKRRRECGNGHRFTTQEIHTPLAQSFATALAFRARTIPLDPELAQDPPTTTGDSTAVTQHGTNA